MDDQSSGFAIVAVKHPILWVPDLGAAAEWFERVFGRTTVSTTDLMGHLPRREGFAIDYGIFHLVQDVFIESIDPGRLVLGGKKSIPLRGIPPTTVPKLSHLGWYVEGAAELYATLRERGMRCQNQVGEVTTELSFGGKTGFISFYTLREEAGLTYQFFEYPTDPERIELTGDPRLRPGWKLSSPPDDDEFGVERCSHHTILTVRPERMLALLVDVLGGQVIHQAENAMLETESTFVALGDAVYECAVPSPDGFAAAGADLEPYDSYHSMTFVVRDLERAEAHLRKHGIRIAKRSDVAIVTDPTTSLGVPWGFTTSLTPGDPRGAVNAG